MKSNSKNIVRIANRIRKTIAGVLAAIAHADYSATIAKTKSADYIPITPKLMRHIRSNDISPFHDV